MLNRVFKTLASMLGLVSGAGLLGLVLAPFVAVFFLALHFVKLEYLPAEGINHFIFLISLPFLLIQSYYTNCMDIVNNWMGIVPNFSGFGYAIQFFMWCILLLIGKLKLSDLNEVKSFQNIKVKSGRVTELYTMLLLILCLFACITGVFLGITWYAKGLMPATLSKQDCSQFDYALARDMPDKNRQVLEILALGCKYDGRRSE